MIFWENVFRWIVIGVFLIILLFAAITDHRKRIIYDACHVVIFILGIPALWLFPGQSLAAKYIGIFAVSLPMLVLSLLVPGAFGGGDIKLMAACGWMLGWSGVLCGFVIAVLCGGAVETIKLVLKKANRKDRFAMGPYLAAGMTAAMFGGDFFIAWFLQ